jgi:two-component system, NtrC family, sensor kinase
MIEAVANRVFRVLIIDDSRNIHEDFRKVLGRQVENSVSQLEAEIFGDAPTSSDPGISFELDSAYQGEEGVALVRAAARENRPYSVAFVDMRMPPGMDGLGTIVKLWEADPQVQVVICSAYSDYSWSEIIARLGQTDRLVILRKPFDNIEVLQLAHSLTTKWSLQQRLQAHLQELEETVSQRTRALHESQALFRLILENTNDLITVIDANKRRVYSSPAHRRLIGYSQEELASMPAFALVHPEDRSAFDELMANPDAATKSTTISARKQHKEGFWLHFEALVGAIRKDDGGILYWVITERDITERHQQEIQVRLNQKLESIGLLAAGIAHEINTPTQFISDNLTFLKDSFGQLSAILASHRTLLDAARAQAALANEVAAADAVETEHELSYLQTEIPRTIEQSLDGIGRVAKIVRSLKEFSHPGSPTRSPMDLNHAIENAVMVCRHEWKYVADVKLDLDPGMPLVPCLADEFNQAILNLLINAAHAIADAQKVKGSGKGLIHVSTHVEDTWAVIKIGDSGTGIPEAIRERIFEPFFTTKPMGKGTGQGLPIVRTVIVGKHQGKIDFVSEVGVGTTFILHLPVSIPEPAKPQA